MPRSCSIKNCKTPNNYKSPKDPETLRKWEEILGLELKNVPKTSVICRKHFKDDDLTAFSYWSGLQNKTKCLKPTAVPSLCLGVGGNETPKNKTSSKGLRVSACSNNAMSRLDKNNVRKSPNNKSLTGPIQSSDFIMLSNKDVGIQTYSSSTIHTTGTQTCAKSCRDVKVQTIVCTRYSYNIMKLQKGSLKYFTGLTNEKHFESILLCLGPAAYELNYKLFQVKKISVEDQFLITLIKLRHRTPDFELAYMFDTSRAMIQNIFFTWINFMAAEWDNLNIWLPKEVVLQHMPKVFKDTYQSAQLTSNDKEFPIQSSSNLRHQQARFCVYKNGSTLKSAVGMTAAALSGLMSEIDPKDPREVDQESANIVLFKKDKSHSKDTTTEKNAQIANKPKSVEKVVGLTKTYKILKQSLPPFYVPLAQEIFYICCVLSNFRVNLEKIE